MDFQENLKLNTHYQILSKRILEELKETKSEFTKKYTNFEQKINSYIKSVEQKVIKYDPIQNKITNLLALSTIHSEKIEQIISKISSMDEKNLKYYCSFNILQNDFVDAKNKLDNMYLNNLYLPGQIGDCCKYSNLKEFLIYAINKFHELEISEELNIKRIKKIDEKINKLFTQFQKTENTIKDAVVDYTNIKIGPLEQKTDAFKIEICEKINQIKIDNMNHIVNLERENKKIIKAKNDFEEFKPLIASDVNKLVSKINEIHKEITNLKKFCGMPLKFNSPNKSRFNRSNSNNNFYSSKFLNHIEDSNNKFTFVTENNNNNNISNISNKNKIKKPIRSIKSINSILPSNFKQFLKRSDSDFKESNNGNDKINNNIKNLDLTSSKKSPLKNFKEYNKKKSSNNLLIISEDEKSSNSLSPKIKNIKDTKKRITIEDIIQKEPHTPSSLSYESNSNDNRKFQMMSQNNSICSKRKVTFEDEKNINESIHQKSSSSSSLNFSRDFNGSINNIKEEKQIESNVSKFNLNNINNDDNEKINGLPNKNKRENITIKSIIKQGKLKKSRSLHQKEKLESSKSIYYKEEKEITKKNPLINSKNINKKQENISPKKYNEDNQDKVITKNENSKGNISNNRYISITNSNTKNNLKINSNVNNNTINSLNNNHNVKNNNIGKKININNDNNIKNKEDDNKKLFKSASLKKTKKLILEDSIQKCNIKNLQINNSYNNKKENEMKELFQKTFFVICNQSHMKKTPNPKRTRNIFKLNEIPRNSKIANKQIFPMVPKPIYFKNTEKIFS